MISDGTELNLSSLVIDEGSFYSDNLYNAQRLIIRKADQENLIRLLHPVVIFVV